MFRTDSSLDAIRTRLRDSRQTELELLTDPAVHEALQAAGFELGTPGG
ncbi:MAG: hypothetical protein IPO77_16315 [Acidobacteria bacterium]|nr:hypothetical protein [Acidobacteriota bacterium]